MVLVKIVHSVVVSKVQVPDVEGSNEDRCELTRYPYGRQFIDEVH